MKILICFLLASVCYIWSGLSAISPEEQAFAFYSVKNTQKARQLYQEILLSPTPSWKEAILMYNIGTLFLLEGRLEEAKEHFEAILLPKDSSPLLIRHLKTNMGVTYFREAHEMMQQHSFNEEKVKLLLEKSLKAFAEAEEAECVLDKLEDPDLKDSLQPHDIKEMTDQVQGLLSRLQQQARYSKITYLSENEEKSPEGVLRQMIADQEHNLTMGFLLQQMPSPADEARKILIVNQQNILKSGEKFLKVSLEEEERAYHEEALCQQHPWDTVFPLFNQGYLHAVSASQYLTLTSQDISLATKQQEDAIKKWEEALQQLQEKKEQGPADPQASQSIQDRFNLIQEMNLEDRIPREPSSPQEKERTLPW